MGPMRPANTEPRRAVPVLRSVVTGPAATSLAEHKVLRTGPP